MKALVVAGILAGVAGCGHVETHAALLRAPSSPSGARVELYLADQPAPTRSFYEIALVQAIGFGTEAHPDMIAAALTKKAGALGCDAVVHAFIDQGYTRAHAAGVCVKWLGPAPADAPPAESILPPDASQKGPLIPVQPAPLPRVDPLPSSTPGRGGSR